MIYQHPLAYLIGLEGLALMRAWAGEYDEDFVRARLAEVCILLEDEELSRHPGVRVDVGNTRDAYRRWATSYDEPGNELLELDLPLIDDILATLPPGAAVDVASGTGRLAGRLAARGHRVTGIDSSEEMLRRARENVPDARFVVGELHTMPLPADSADVLTSGLALTHVADLPGVLAELARVLRPGGTAILSEVHPARVHLGSIVKSETATGEPEAAAFHRHSVAAYVRAALGAGFTLRRLEELQAVDVEPDPAPEVSLSDLGPWRQWPWALLDRVPEAARASWDDQPALLVMHLELP